MWAPRWLGYQLSRVAPLFFRWRGSPSVNAAFKVSASLGYRACLASPCWRLAGGAHWYRAARLQKGSLCCRRACLVAVQLCSMLCYGVLQACGAICVQAELDMDLYDTMMGRSTESLMEVAHGRRPVT